MRIVGSTKRDRLKEESEGDEDKETTHNLMNTKMQDKQVHEWSHKQNLGDEELGNG